MDFFGIEVKLGRSWLTGSRSLELWGKPDRERENFTGKPPGNASPAPPGMSVIASILFSSQALTSASFHLREAREAVIASEYPVTRLTVG